MENLIQFVSLSILLIILYYVVTTRYIIEENDIEEFKLPLEQYEDELNKAIDLESIKNINKDKEIE